VHSKNCALCYDLVKQLFMDRFFLHKKKFNFFKSALSDSKLHHAYIFYGPEGSGKFSFAQALAQFIQCEDRNEKGACGKCSSCKSSVSGFIIDTYIINPDSFRGEKVSKKIHIEEVRQAKRFLGLSSSGGRKKILIINDAHNVSSQAKEVLLKTLEEPPNNSLIILVTSEKNDLPKTIISRCHCVFFPKISKERFSSIINEDLLDNNLFDIAYSCNLGRLGFLEELKNRSKEEIIDKYNQLILELNLIISKKQFSKMIFAKEIGEIDALRQKIESWIGILYNIFLFKKGVILWEKREQEMLSDLEKKLICGKIEVILGKLLHILELLDTNVSRRVLMENFMLTL